MLKKKNHMARLDGKIALITAADQGIGRATALRFADEGAIVWAIDIRGNALDALRSENPAIQTRILDVLDSKAVETTAEETGTIDVLFNCAGFLHQGSIFECSENELNFCFGFQSLRCIALAELICPECLQMEKEA